MTNFFENTKFTRRDILKATAAGVAVGTSNMFPAVDAFAKSDDPIRIGIITSLTSTYATLGINEVGGAKLAAERINKNGGIMGRPVQLIIEDGAGKPDEAVQKARKLIHRDKVNFITGTVSSAVALALEQTTSDLGVFYIDAGGHTDAVTGRKCSWNTFRTCGTSWEVSAGNAKILYDKFGGKWFFITPDFAFGHSAQAAYTKMLEGFGGQVVGSALHPFGATDFSSYLIKAKAANPDVLMVLSGGDSLVDCLKQAKQFGITNDMAVAGGQNELENVAALPPEARYGWWTFEWYWYQPDVPHVADFVNAYKQRNANKVPTARSWMTFVSVHAIGLAINKANSTNTFKVVKAMEGMELPPEVALEPGPVFYRAGDHQLIANMYPGYVKKNGTYPDLFQVAEVVSGSKIALSVEESGCRMTYPS